MNLTNFDNIPNKEEFIEKGKKIYEEKIKPLEQEKNGMYVAIEVESGDFFINETSEGAVAEAKEKYPEKFFYIARIGAPASISLRFSEAL